MSANHSYSQLGEDRVIAHIFKKSPPGFYVDIGAFHPSKYSNTHLLYKQGWRGINADLSSATIALMNEHRPEDINIRAAIGSSQGEVQAYMFGEGPTTINTVSPVVAAEWAERFRQEYSVEVVPAMTLDHILDKHGSGRSLDFLNIDVEGLEDEVLDGFSISRHSPKVVAIEVHAPNARTALNNKIVARMTEAGYDCVAFMLITAIFVKKA